MVRQHINLKRPERECNRLAMNDPQHLTNISSSGHLVPREAQSQ